MMLAKSRSRPLQRIDTSALPFGQAPRIRSRAHLDWIKRLKCIVPGCSVRECDPHHLLQCADPKGRSITAGDNWAVNLCRIHHDELHGLGDEQAFADRHGLDLVATAAELWRHSQNKRRTSANGC